MAKKKVGNKIPIICATKGNLYRNASKVRVNKTTKEVYHSMLIPLFVLDKNGKKGMRWRKCTVDYKINIIQREIRKFCEVKRGTKTPVVQMMIGISYDESQRMKDAKKLWYENTYPLVDRKITRADCIKWLNEHGYPQPPRSACIFCPYHSNEEWARIKETMPDEFAKVVKFERRCQVASRNTNTPFVPFLHNSLKPIDTIDFKTNRSMEDWSWGNECEGMCGV